MTLRLPCALLILFFTATIYADERPGPKSQLKIIPRVTTSIQSLDFEDKLENSLSFDTQYTSIGAGFGLVKGRWFVDTSLDRNLPREELLVDDNNAKTSGEVKRTDKSVSVGYITPVNLILFSGYRWGETDVKATITSIRNGLPNFINISVETEEQGFFIGSGYQMVVLSDMTIAFHAALAQNDASIKDSRGFTDDNLSAVGYSVGAQANIPIGNRLTLTADTNYRKFDYDSPQQSTKNEYSVAVLQARLQVKLAF